MMASLVEQLAARGSDTEGALARFLGDEALYSDCFRMFLTDPCFAQLEHALARQDLSTAFTAAHTLKGVAGNLGLTALYTALSALVEALRREQAEGLAVLYRAAESERDALLQLLEQ